MACSRGRAMAGSESSNTIPMRSGIRRDVRAGLCVSLTLTFASLGVVVGTGRVYFGSVSAALSYLQSERLLADHKVHSLGDLVIGSKQKFSFGLRNMTGRSVRLLGARTSCSCALLKELPEELENGESRRVELEVAAPQEPMAILGGLELFTSDPNVPVLTLGFTGRAVASGSSEGVRNP